MIKSLFERIVLTIAAIILGAFFIWIALRDYNQRNEIEQLRKERIASDSLRKVAKDQYELKARQVESQKLLMKDLHDQNDVLATELDKRDVKITELTQVVIKLRDDSAHGSVDAVDTSKGRVDFTLQSNNKLVTLKGFTKMSPRFVDGIFTFAVLPLLSIVLYEDELQYINARVTMDERIAQIVDFHIERYKPKPIEEGWRWIAGLGLVRVYNSPMLYGMAAIGGATYGTVGLASVVTSNSLGIMFLKTF